MSRRNNKNKRAFGNATGTDKELYFIPLVIISLITSSRSAKKKSLFRLPDTRNIFYCRRGVINNPAALRVYLFPHFYVFTPFHCHFIITAGPKVNVRDKLNKMERRTCPDSPGDISKYAFSYRCLLWLIYAGTWY